MWASCVSGRRREISRSGVFLAWVVDCEHLLKSTGFAAVTLQSFVLFCFYAVRPSCVRNHDTYEDILEYIWFFYSQNRYPSCAPIFVFKIPVNFCYPAYPPVKPLSRCLSIFCTFFLTRISTGRPYSSSYILTTCDINSRFFEVRFEIKLRLK